MSVFDNNLGALNWKLKHPISAINISYDKIRLETRRVFVIFCMLNSVQIVLETDCSASWLTVAQLSGKNSKIHFSTKKNSYISYGINNYYYG